VTHDYYQYNLCIILYYSDTDFVLYSYNKNAIKLSRLAPAHMPVGQGGTVRNNGQAKWSKAGQYPAH